MAIGTILTAIGIGTSIYGAVSSKKAGDEAREAMIQGGQLSRDASYLNAADAERLGQINAAAITGAAANNAAMTLALGYENAQAIVEATVHNARMYAIQAQETIRQHIRGERWLAGDIRAALSSSGVMVNGGSPQAFLESQITAGLQERQFVFQRDALTLIGEAEDGLRRSMLTQKEAQLNANVMKANAALQAQVTIAEATAQAAAMRRQGDIAAEVGVANGQAAYYGGLSNAIGAIGSAARYAGQAYNSWKGSQASAVTYPSAPSYASAGSSYNPTYFQTGQVGF